MQSTISLNELSKLQSDKEGKSLPYIEDSKLKLYRDETLNTMRSTESFNEQEGNVFKLLTFNTWGLKYVSKFRKERLMAIADRLSGAHATTDEAIDIDDYDIVALQEIWSKEDWNYIDQVCSNKYAYRRWFSSGIIAGPGLAVLSKYPIKKTFLYRFPINGRPSAFFRGDWYVGKSVAVSILVLPDNSTIALLNSHMHAPYAANGDAAYDTHRACQAWEISIIVDELKAAGHSVILVGDLNSRPGSLPYRILEDDAGLSDSWELLHGKTELELVKTMDPWEQIIRAATTCDSILNTWRAQRRPDEACRLDYALVDSSALQPIQASVRFTEKIPNIGSYSDHFAYSATFRVKNKNETSSHEKCKIRSKDKLLKVYQDLTELVNEYIDTTLVWQRNWRMWHFVISFFIALAFLPVITVVSYRAPWSSILFYFFGCVIFVTGVVNGLISLLFGRYELRNLTEVVLEVNDRINFIKNFGE
ncbi:phospholipase C type enzyme [Pichia californica]|uniref:Phospholipase C type enzyme n=1 Tax=Pichia californica TaxID=460514 RepID=A0A9P7BGV8_9ASCO|nr:phospholipase C type enzyme [[Candida] californica]KAG0688743.1 phospholipase C type enzyme [[Candida] californica]